LALTFRSRVDIYLTAASIRTHFWRNFNYFAETARRFDVLVIRQIHLNVSVILLSLYTVSLINFSYQEGLTVYSKIIGLGIVAYFLIRIVRERAIPTLPVEYGLWLAWFLWALITSINATNVDLAFAKIFTLLQLIVLSVAIYSILLSLNTTRPFWFALIAAALIACGVTLANPEKFIDWSGRISGPLGNANIFGVVLTSSLAAALAYTATTKSFAPRIAFLAVSIFLFYMIAETGSRKSMLGSILIIIIVSAVVLNHIRKANTMKFLLASVAGLVLVIGGITYLASSQHVDRLERAVSAVAAGDMSKADGSLQHRARFYELAVEQTAKHPVLGIGLDNFQGIDLGFFRSPETYSHSNYLEIMVSTGIPGLVLYCSIYAVLLIKLYSLRSCVFRNNMLGPFAICASIVPMVAAFDFAMVSYYEKVSWLILSAVIAQLEILRQKANQIGD